LLEYFVKVCLFLSTGLHFGWKLAIVTLALAANAGLIVVLLADVTNCRRLAVGTANVVLRAIGATFFIGELLWTTFSEQHGETSPSP
jgi:hypothetical protein